MCVDLATHIIIAISKILILKSTLSLNKKSYLCAKQ